jgi:hypothetical protein
MPTNADDKIPPLRGIFVLELSQRLSLNRVRLENWNFGVYFPKRGKLRISS